MSNILRWFQVFCHTEQKPLLLQRHCSWNVRQATTIKWMQRLLPWKRAPVLWRVEAQLCVQWVTNVTTLWETNINCYIYLWQHSMTPRHHKVTWVATKTTRLIETSQFNVVANQIGPLWLHNGVATAAVDSNSIHCNLVSFASVATPSANMERPMRLTAAWNARETTTRCVVEKDATPSTVIPTWLESVRVC